MAKNENHLSATELRERNDAELKSLLLTKTEDLYKARFKHTLGQLRETHSIGATRKDIARITTILNERSKKS